MGKRYTTLTDHSRLGFEYRSYARRWLMLLALFLLNLSSGMMYLTYSPIPQYTASFYGVSEKDVDGFSITFSATTFVIGLGSIVVLDTWGLKVALYFGATCNVLGSIIRWISTISPILCSHDYQRSGFMVAMIGQTITAFAQPFLLYAPTKLASFWFGPKERAICTGIATVGNPVGIAIANLLSPHIIMTSGLPTLLWIYIIPAAVAFVLTVCAFWKSRPSIPPAASVSSETPTLASFLKGLAQVLKNGSFWGLLLTWGTSAGLFNAMITIVPQMLCTYGYSSKDVGLWVALMIFVGVIGSMIASFILDYTKMFKEVAVLSFGFSILCFLWFSEVYRLYDQSVNIAFSLCVFGFFALPLVPVCMELGVEITYPVAEATSSGLLWSSVQIFAVFFIVISNWLQTPVSPNEALKSSCGAALTSHVTSCSSFPSNVTDTAFPQDMTNALYAYVGVVVCAFLYIVVAFRPDYKRTQVDRSDLGPVVPS